MLRETFISSQGAAGGHGEVLMAKGACATAALDGFLEARAVQKAKDANTRRVAEAEALLEDR